MYLLIFDILMRFKIIALQYLLYNKLYKYIITNQCGLLKTKKIRIKFNLTKINDVQKKRQRKST